MAERESDKIIQIEEAIQSFNNKKLYESSIAFFKSLDYQSNKTAQISSNNYDGFIDSFNLSKNAINKDRAFVSHWKYIEFIFQVADSEITRVQSLFDTGEVDSNEYQSFLFFTIQLKEENYKRGDLVKITRELNVPFKMPVIVLFKYGNKLTLSIIDRRLHKKDTSKDVLEKVTLIKDIDIANPQRAHKEILKDLSLSELYKKFEFHSFVKLHEAWKATLNISELNKKFYKELAYWYFWALQEVKFPDDELKDDKTRNPVNVIRLITRLIFVWFLKEKNLIPDDLFNKRELDKILDYKDKTGSTYYKAILQNLFFATLNTEMNKDVKDKNKISRTFVNRNTGVPHYFRYSRFIKDQDKFATWMNNIPFLNGGLFECLDKRTKDKDIFIDGFTQQLKNESTLKVPDYLFFNEAPQNIDLNNTFHTKGKKYEVRGLIDILSRYKFTIEENTPVEEEVALDPELLGKVFENLLASYNEETETTARKLTGSFYTPREIVNYMVDESLITYLCNSLLKEDDEKKREELNERLHHLFSYTAEEPQFADAERNELIDAIDNCKILDPACGSGAFPMGILHKLVFILSKLDPNNKKWKQKQQDKAKRDMMLAEKMEDDKNRDAAIKEIDLRIKDIDRAFNQNNHELDFARKLYLIENCIYGVDKQPVAIQISKLRFFIALIVDQKTENDSEPNRGIRPLPNLETKFVAADTLVSIEKPNGLLVNLVLEKEMKQKEDEIHRVREKHFRARTPETKEKYRHLDAQHRDELALLLEKDGFPKDATKKLAGWNPYDQNKFADFFDPMWMFEIEKGFDIVIGNPPYRIITKNNTAKSEIDYYMNKYQSIKNSSSKNLYAVFIEKGVQLTARKGVLSFIVPEGLFKTRSYEDCVVMMNKNGTTTNVTTFSAFVFENAVTGSLVFNFTKDPSLNYTTKKYQFDAEFNLSELEDDNFDIVNLIQKNSDEPLNKVAGLFKGIVVQDRDSVISETKSGKKDRFLLGKNISKWQINSYYYTNYSELIAVGGTKKKAKHDIEPRILIRRTGDSLCCVYLEKKAITESTLYSVWSIDHKYDNKYLLSLLNSSCLNYYIRQLMITNKQAFPQILMTDLEELPIKYHKNQFPFISLVNNILVAHEANPKTKHESNNQFVSEYFEQVLNGCVYELYFGEEMKKAGVDILTLVEKDLEAVKKLSPEISIVQLYNKWQEPKNEVRNRLLLMATRCPDTIGVIEANA